MKSIGHIPEIEQATDQHIDIYCYSMKGKQDRRASTQTLPLSPSFPLPFILISPSFLDKLILFKLF